MSVRFTKSHDRSAKLRVTTCSLVANASEVGWICWLLRDADIACPPDLQSFRTALAKLQSQVDELDRMKVEHYKAVLEHEEETWDHVLKHVRFVSVLAYGLILPADSTPYQRRSRLL